MNDGAVDERTNAVEQPRKIVFLVLLLIETFVLIRGKVRFPILGAGGREPFGRCSCMVSDGFSIRSINLKELTKNVIL